MIEPATPGDVDIPTIALAGKDWPVPELVWRDLKTCRKELIELQGLVNAAIAASQGPAGESAAARGLRYLGVVAEVFEGLGDAEYDRLVMGVLLTALRAAHPGLTREEFEGWRTTEAERQLAWLTVRRQSGLFVFHDTGAAPTDDDADDAGDDASGEAAGAA
jgi:hypothetical protein